MTGILTILLLSLVHVHAQDGIPVPSVISCEPNDAPCLIKNAQYTVLGTVSNTFIDAPGATISRFNATLMVHCVWTSFSNPISSGEGIAGNSILVANWGKPKVGCPKGRGAEAPVGVTQIYFLNVAVRPKAGVLPKDMIYSVQAICVGGIDPSESTAVAKLMATSPKNRIDPANQGVDPRCQLPIPTGVVAPEAAFTPPSGSAQDSFSVLSGFLSSLLYFII
ncbi:hypothetical protein BC833DRAFT_595331 [Globomyces pollinis-pini]|nr:hypothetical protein BC833DRAFT_595331 [Globomyces pollinis-pini]KAJ2996270.1 hypothetical protein HDV02_006667 [Globomyces sp. JEL0801]